MALSSNKRPMPWTGIHGEPALDRFLIKAVADPAKEPEAEVPLAA